MAYKHEVSKHANLAAENELVMYCFCEIKYIYPIHQKQLSSLYSLNQISILNEAQRQAANPKSEIFKAR